MTFLLFSGFFSSPFLCLLVILCVSVSLCPPLTFSDCIQFLLTGELPSLRHNDVTETRVNDIFTYLRKQVQCTCCSVPPLLCVMCLTVLLQGYHRYVLQPQLNNNSIVILFVTLLHNLVHIFPLSLCTCIGMWRQTKRFTDTDRHTHICTFPYVGVLLLTNHTHTHVNK